MSRNKVYILYYFEPNPLISKVCEREGLVSKRVAAWRGCEFRKRLFSVKDNISCETQT
jgi:hypothetical protein